MNVQIRNESPVSEISEMVQRDEIPSRELLIEEAGEDLVDIIYFALASFEGIKREGNHPYARHVIDPILRDIFWKYDRKNTKSTKIVLVTHDGGEELGKTLPGSRIINRLQGLIFGEDYEIAGNFMTDYENLIAKLARKQGAVTRDKPNEDITLQQVNQDIDSIRGLLTNNSRLAQENALGRFQEANEYFANKVDSSSLSDPDKRYIRSLLDFWNEARIKAKNNLVSSGELATFTDRKVDGLIKSIEKNGVIDEYSFFDDQGSHAYHAARVAASKRYSWTLVHFDGHSEARRVRDFNGYDLRAGKEGDSGDNLRIPKSSRFDDLARLHLKGSIYIQTEQEKLDEEPESPQKEDAVYQLDKLKGQYAWAIIRDASSLSLHGDSISRDAEAWTVSKFIELENVVGSGFLKSFRNDLQNRPNELAATPIKAQNILEAYEKLNNQYLAEEGLFRRMTKNISGITGKLSSMGLTSFL